MGKVNNKVINCKDYEMGNSGKSLTTEACVRELSFFESRPAYGLCRLEFLVIVLGPSKRIPGASPSSVTTVFPFHWMLYASEMLLVGHISRLYQFDMRLCPEDDKNYK
jgi:hypothetical protein